MLKPIILIIFVQLLSNPLLIGQDLHNQLSTYDNPGYADRIKSQKESLKELENNHVFSKIHAKLIKSIGKKHQKYFNSKPDYRLLFISNGDLFQNKKNDYVFILYDKKSEMISIVAYNELSNVYSKLYREIKVENGLERTQCYQNPFVSLDYQVTDDIVEQMKNLLENPGKISEIKICKIVNIMKDNDFVTSRGCFSDRGSKEDFLKTTALCIATSTVYNNWECLQYDKSKNKFVVFYSQAFAD